MHEGRNGRKGIASYISAVEKAVAEFIENNNITAGWRSYISAVGKAVAEFIENNNITAGWRQQINETFWDEYDKKPHSV